MKSEALLGLGTITRKLSLGKILLKINNLLKSLPLFTKI
jgi:hypothetical protein